MKKLDNYKKFEKDIESILKLRNEFVRICAQKLHSTKQRLVWSSVIAPSIIMSLILSHEFEHNHKKRIYANCLIDICHLYFALNDRIQDQQIPKKEIENYKRTAEIFRCCFKEILENAYSIKFITKDLKDFFKSFFDNLIKYAKKKVYPKDEEIKVKNLNKVIINGDFSRIFTPKDIIDVHKTKFGNFFRGMGYFMFKFYDLKVKNKRAYFDLFYNIGMFAQLIDDLRDFFWQDIEIEQPNIVMALFIHKSWDLEGERFRDILLNKDNMSNRLVTSLNDSLDKMHSGKISLYKFYKSNFPQTYTYIEELVQNYKEHIQKCLKELNIEQITADEIVEIYGFLIPLIKKILLKIIS